MSWSKAAAPIGSSPAVGSSRKTISGSRARARARPARLRMPPESSDGYFEQAKAGNPTMPIFTPVISSINSLGRSVYSFIGTWMFCPTVSELNRAPSWNSTPHFCM